MAAAVAPDSNVCFAELIVRLDSLLTLRSQEDQEQDEQAHAELEADIKLKLNELHLRLKNGGAVQDRNHLGEDDDEDDEALNIDDSQGPSSANETSGMIFFIIFYKKAIKDLAKLLISVSSFQLLDLWTV